MQTVRSLFDEILRPHPHRQFVRGEAKKVSDRQLMLRKRLMNHRPSHVPSCCQPVRQRIAHNRNVVTGLEFKLGSGAGRQSGYDEGGQKVSFHANGEVPRKRSHPIR